MSKEKYSKLTRGERLLSCCFGSTSRTMTTAYTIVLVPILLSFILPLFQLTPDTVSFVTTLSSIVWAGVLALACHYYNRHVDEGDK